jgi:ankyrin repeat protein
LIDSGLDINLVDSEGYLAIHKAVLGANPKVLEALLAAGADPNVESLPVTPPTLTGLKTMATVVLVSPSPSFFLLLPPSLTFSLLLSPCSFLQILAWGRYPLLRRPSLD